MDDEIKDNCKYDANGCNLVTSDTILLDKLAQPCYFIDNSIKNNILQRRARAKFISTPLALGLINNNPHSILKKSYWNTYYCNCTISIQEGKASAKYCKNRWCLVCSRIKTATSINSYYPVIKELPDKQFVTLTVKNVPYKSLSKKIDEMQSAFNQIKSNNKLRGSFKGIRKLEITYNPLTDEYHPHYHLIVSGFDVSTLLVDYWLKIFADASADAQDIRSIDNDDSALIEIFKYATKIIQKDIDRPGQKTIYFSALNNILIALRCRRTFQTFGGIKKIKVEDDFSLEMENKSTNIDLYFWEQELADWLNLDTGELLSNYVPAEMIRKFVTNLGKKTNK